MPVPGAAFANLGTKGFLGSRVPTFRRAQMNEDQDQDRVPGQQTRKKQRPEWRQDLKPDHRPGEKIGQLSDAQVDAEWKAFHLRKRGLDLGGVNDGQE